MTQKQILFTIQLSQEEIDQLDSIRRPNLECKNRDKQIIDILKKEI